MATPRCPGCRSPVDVRWLWDTVPMAYRSYALRGTVGVHCSTCGARLVVTQTGVKLVGLGHLAFLALLAITSQLAHASLAVVGLFYLPVGILSFFVAPWIARSAAGLRLARGDEQVSFPARGGSDAS